MACTRSTSPTSAAGSTADSYADGEAYRSGGGSLSVAGQKYITFMNRSSSQVKVKNTFIDGFESDDDEDDFGVPVCASMSLPARRRSLAELACSLEAPAGLAADAECRSAPEEALKEPSEISMTTLPSEAMSPVHSAKSSLPPHETPKFSPGLADASADEPSLPPWLSNSEQESHEEAQPQQPMKKHASEPANAVVALDDRQPEMSLGSKSHDDGDCKPCAWFWRPQGCTNGLACRHCHMCPSGEVKSRRRHKVAGMRKVNTTRAAERRDAARSM